MTTVQEYATIDPEFKAKWLEALRSGNYEQVGGALRKYKGPELNPVGFCCLGVACDIIDPNQWAMTGVDEWLTDTDSNNWDEFIPTWNNIDGETTALPFLSQVTGAKLANMNDGTGAEGRKYSFDEIADWIEINL